MKKLLFGAILGLVPAACCATTIMVQNNLNTPVYGDFYSVLPRPNFDLHLKPAVPAGKMLQGKTDSPDFGYDFLGSGREFVNFNTGQFQAVGSKNILKVAFPQFIIGAGAFPQTIIGINNNQQLGFIIGEEGDYVVVTAYNLTYHLKNNKIDTRTKLFDGRMLKKDFYGK